MYVYGWYRWQQLLICNKYNLNQKPNPLYLQIFRQPFVNEKFSQQFSKTKSLELLNLAFQYYIYRLCIRQISREFLYWWKGIDAVAKNQMIEWNKWKTIYYRPSHGRRFSQYMLLIGMYCFYNSVEELFSFLSLILSAAVLNKCCSKRSIVFCSLYWQKILLT